MMHRTQPGTDATNRPTAQLGLRPLWEPGPPGTSASYPQSKQDEHDFAQRLMACVIALAMPPDGVDEHLEETLNQLRYWNEMAQLR